MSQGAISGVTGNTVYYIGSNVSWYSKKKRMHVTGVVKKIIITASGTSLIVNAIYSDRRWKQPVRFAITENTYKTLKVI